MLSCRSKKLFNVWDICSSDKSLYRSISTIERYAKSEFNEIYDIFKTYWDLQMDEYIEIVNEPRIIISYNIVPNQGLRQCYS